MSQKDLAAAIGCSQSAIAMYESGRRVPDVDTFEALADTFNVPTYAFYIDEKDFAAGNKPVPTVGLVPVTLHKVPLLGNVAAGKPIYSDQPVETYVASADHKADFALVVKGDSMDPTYKDGDIVFIRSQPDVHDGQIAAVGIDDEATLKRVYHVSNGLQLLSINPNYPPMLFTEDNCDNLTIFGLAVGYYRKMV